MMAGKIQYHKFNLTYLYIWLCFQDPIQIYNCNSFKHRFYV